MRVAALSLYWASSAGRVLTYMRPINPSWLEDPPASVRRSTAS